MQCNNRCTVCPVVLASLPKEVVPCWADTKVNFLKKLKGKPVLYTNARAFFYQPLAERVAPRISKALVLNFGRNASENDRNTGVKGSFEQARIGEANLRNAGVRVETKTVFSPSSHQVTYTFPEEVVIELTSKCNLDCRHCFGRTGKDLMDTAYVKEIIDSMRKAKIERVRFSGGEPLLRHDLLELIDYAKSKGLVVWLNTNALLLTKEFVDKIENKIENVLLPFNSWDRQSEKRWTRSDSYIKKLRGAKLLKRSRIPMVRAGTVATKENIRHLEKIFDQVNSLDSWEVWKPVTAKEEPFDLQSLIPKLVRLSMEWGKLIPIANHTPFCDYKKDIMDVMCLGGCFDNGHSRLVVDSEGFVKPSYFDRTNLGDPRNVMACWNTTYMKKIRGLVNVSAECKACKFLDKCKGR